MIEHRSVRARYKAGSWPHLMGCDVCLESRAGHDDQDNGHYAGFTP
ncbi:MAG: hypothetical protein R6V55_08170 [Desulfovermiculus sp.]